MTTKKENGLAAGISEPETVDAYIDKLKHPLKDVVEKLRTIILKTDKTIGEGIYWNAPTFYYTGKMKPFNPKEYKRYLVGFNLFQKDCVRLIFLRGASVKDKTGLLEGEYKDGRRLAMFKSLKDVKTHEKALQDILKQLIKTADK
jgi:hypothetical protein